MEETKGTMCPVCHSHNIVSTCAGYFGVDNNRVHCQDCDWKGIAEHTRTYAEFKTDSQLEYEKQFVLVDQDHEDSTIGTKYRVKGKCKCGRDLMVVNGCAAWCSSGPPGGGGPCQFGLMSG
jgi:hypothetical protein